jgi:sphingosine kinase
MGETPIRAVVKYKTKRRLLRCTSDGLKVSGIEQTDEKGVFADYNEIYAVNTEKEKLFSYFVEEQNSYSLLIYAFIPWKKKESSKRKPKLFRFEMNSYEETQELMKNIRERIETSHEHAIRPSQRVLLIIINPFSGKKNAQTIFENIMKPMLNLAGITQMTCIVTQYYGHAKEIITELENLLEYTDIVSIGGDGTVHEIINGLMRRSDAAHAVKIALSVIPTGTGNALAASLNLFDVYIAVWNLIKRFIRPMDLLAITQGPRVYYSFLFLSWAFLADVDIESEAHRWLGRTRFSVAAIVRLIFLRQYRACLYYLENDEHLESYSLNQHPKKRDLFCTGTGSWKERTLMPLPSEGGKRAFLSPWKQIDDNFFFFIGLNLSNVGLDERLAPLANFQDGAIDLCYIVGNPYLRELIPLFLKSNRGEHIHSPLYEYHHVKAFYLEPRVTHKHHSLGIMDVDGECMPTEPCLVECLSQVVTLSCPYDLL